jgi:hypothetical protein
MKDQCVFATARYGSGSDFQGFSEGFTLGLFDQTKIRRTIRGAIMPFNNFGNQSESNQHSVN